MLFNHNIPCGLSTSWKYGSSCSHPVHVATAVVVANQGGFVVVKLMKPNRGSSSRTSCTPSPRRAIALATPIAIASSRLFTLQTRPSVRAALVCPRCLSTPHVHLVRVLGVNVRVEILAVAVCRNPSQHFLVALALRQRLLLHRRGVELEPIPLCHMCMLPLLVLF